MQKTVNERLKFLIDELENGVPARFAKSIGVAASVIGNYLPGSSREGEPSFSVLQKIGEAYPQINIEWLVKGVGQPFKNEVQEPAAPYGMQLFTTGKEKKHELQAIPLYDITASAGLSALYNSSNNILDYLSIPNLPRCDGAINVKGDSMYPLLKHGDIVVFQRLQDLQDEIMYGEMYVVDMSTPHLERIYVKYVQKSDKGEDYVRLVSYNEKHHPPKDVAIKKIRAMAAVKASIRIS